MIAHVSTILDTSVERAWHDAKQGTTLLYVTKGLFGVTNPAQFLTDFQEGAVFQTQLNIFTLFPLWQHELRIVRVDEQRHELNTNEFGGLLRVWNHLIRIEPCGDNRCCYTDEIELQAGQLTLFAWP